MKKLLACILALAMVCGLAVTASAAGGNLTISASGTPADIGDVTVNVTEGATINTYHIIVAWEDLSFSFTKNGQRWDAEQHTYVSTGSGAFTGGTTADITVTNKSDVDISVTANVADKSASDGFKATLNKTTFDLDSYVGLATPATNTFTLTVSTDGTPGTGTVNVADVSVTITKK